MRRVTLAVVLACALWGAPGAFAAGWCGTGGTPIDRPDITTGPQVHAIWAVPSDGGDTFGVGAPKLADDLASITAWWQGQDPTRVPRIDQALFGATSCADISYVRLPDPTSAFTIGSNAAFQRVESDLADAGFDQPWKKYYVYFDGPSVQQNVCGTGGGEFDFGPAYAITWLGGCPGVPTDSIGAHELLHALGALPAGAPHPCTGDTGHPCDSPQDVLYPYNSGAPLSSLLLDFNHDDYYGHSGTWPDLQDSVWMHRLDVPPVPVIELVRGGPGSIASDWPSPVCTAECADLWDVGSRVTLTALPGPQRRFVAWQGACSGSDPCELSIASPESVFAVFGPKTVAVKLSVAGRGRIACTPRCRPVIPGGSSLRLRAIPAAGWAFARWSGSCRGTAPFCSPPTDSPLAVRATFRKK